jgi:hypothetical protein
MSIAEELAEQQREDELRAQVEARPEQAADAIAETIGLAVAESLARGDFVTQLAERGWVLVQVGDGSCPEPPAEWLHDGIDITAQGWIDPIGRLHELWQTAWEAGRQAGNDERGLAEQVRKAEFELQRANDLLAEVRQMWKADLKRAHRAEHRLGMTHPAGECGTCDDERLATKKMVKPTRAVTEQGR